MSYINNKFLDILPARFHIRLVGFWILFISVFCYSQVQIPQQQQQQVYYPQQTSTNGYENGYDNNYSQ